MQGQAFLVTFFGAGHPATGKSDSAGRAETKSISRLGNRFGTTPQETQSSPTSIIVAPSTSQELSEVMERSSLSGRNNLPLRRIRRHPLCHPLGILAKTPRSAEQEHHGQQQARRNQIHRIVQAD